MARQKRQEDVIHKQKGGKMTHYSVLQSPAVVTSFCGLFVGGAPGLRNSDHRKVFIAVNAINGTKAVVGGNYLNAIIAETNKNILTELIPDVNLHQGVEMTATYWFNPKLNYKIAIIPGILAVLVTMIGGFLSALNIVKEKESGTIEQINVTPIKKWEFILGKLLPFIAVGAVVFSVGLFFARLVYGIVPRGT